jgi:uncharacterized protein YciI
MSASEEGSTEVRKHLGKALYIIFSEPIPNSGDRRAIHPQHLARQYELERTGVLFAAGPFVDEDSKPQGPGMIIVRASNEAEAQAIAEADPYHQQGFRRFRIQKWMLNEGSLGLRVNFSNQTFGVD